MKKKVAMILQSVNNGWRTYIAVDKTNKQVFTTTVYDCGHGASIAYEKLRAAGFEPTSAEWAMKLIRQHNSQRLTW